jgi:hypothetical protein
MSPTIPTRHPVVSRIGRRANPPPMSVTRCWFPADRGQLRVDVLPRQGGADWIPAPVAHHCCFPLVASASRRRAERPRIRRSGRSRLRGPCGSSSGRAGARVSSHRDSSSSSAGAAPDSTARLRVLPRCDTAAGTSVSPFPGAAGIVQLDSARRARRGTEERCLRRGAQARRSRGDDFFRALAIAALCRRAGVAGSFAGGVDGGPTCDDNGRDAAPLRLSRRARDPRHGRTKSGMLWPGTMDRCRAVSGRTFRCAPVLHTCRATRRELTARRGDAMPGRTCCSICRGGDAASVGWPRAHAE